MEQEPLLPTPSTPSLTPLMQQYFALKAQAQDALLFFRMGDFYELFDQDAVLAAPLLGITLTSRDKKSENPMPMAGVPFHSAQQYIQKLLKNGKKVSIAEQMDTPLDDSKIVQRKIIRTFTPAVQFEVSQSGRAFLGTIIDGTLALLDPSTGLLKISKTSTEEELKIELEQTPIAHFLKVGNSLPTTLIKTLEMRSCLIEELTPHWVTQKQTQEILEKQYQKKIFHPLLEAPSARLAASILLQYTLQTQGLETLAHLGEPQPLHEHHAMILGPNTYSHLDLEDLYLLINTCGTSMGSRALKNLLENPYKDLSNLHSQQTATQTISQLPRTHQESLRAIFKNIYDLDRILGRIATRLAHPRDVLSLIQSLLTSFKLIDLLQAPLLSNSNKLQTYFEQLKESHVQLSQFLEKTKCELKEDAPLHTRDGGIFEFGTHPDLDRYLRLTTEGEKYLVDLEAQEREKTGIQSLKVKYNRVFGYFIEVSSANLSKVPEHYQRKQTMVNGERFFTEELKKFEEEILTASLKQKHLEQELFEELLQKLTTLMPEFKKLSTCLAELDVLLALAQLYQKPNWNFPTIDDSLELHLQHGRHPVVEESLKGHFVANSIQLKPHTASTLLITGPNMGGKSTFMRQVAQIVLLGQMGAPVPATQAQWGIFHSLYTRIGAHDAIAQGRSTFMVEMVELAHLLCHANERSLVILDEVGRGTSTFDGMAVASASLKHLHAQAKARILFATHYHELTQLESELQGLQNAYLKVSEENRQIQFLYEIALGKSSQSFGIHVAEMAGLPKKVIHEAWDILHKLEATALSPTSELQQQLQDLPLFAQAASSEFESMLSGLNIDQLRPLEALNLLQDWKTRLNRS